jgi:CRP/FNR family cyclic AMP-dependent transcriptional regulator
MEHIHYLLYWLSETDIDWLLKETHTETISPGTYILREGEPTDALFIVVEGSFLVESSSSANSPTDIKVGPGEILGEMSFVDQSNPSSSVKTNETSQILKIRRDLLDSKLQNDLGFSSRFFHGLSAILAYRVRNLTKPNTTVTEPKTLAFLEKTKRNQ